MIFAVLPIVLAATVVAPLPQEPQVGGGDLSEIRFHEGRQFMGEGRYAEALTKLIESERLKPTPVTLLNIALCHVELGKLGNALFELREAKEEDSRAEPDVTSFMADRRREVEAKVAAAPVPHVEIAFEPGAGAPGMRVALDEIWLSSALLAQPIPVDEGEHRVTARDNQGHIADQKVYVHGRDTAKVDLSFGAPPASSLGPLFTSALAVGGIGFAATVVTSVVAHRRRDTYNQKSGNPMVTDDELGEARDSAANWQRANLASIVVAAAGAVVAGTIYWRRPSETAAKVSPVVSGDGHGVNVSLLWSLP